MPADALEVGGGDDTDTSLCDSTRDVYAQTEWNPDISELETALDELLDDIFEPFLRQIDPGVRAVPTNLDPWARLHDNHSLKPRLAVDPRFSITLPAAPVVPLDNTSAAAVSAVDENELYLRGSFSNIPWFPGLQRDASMAASPMPWEDPSEAEMATWRRNLFESATESADYSPKTDEEQVLTSSAAEMFGLPGTTRSDLTEWLSSLGQPETKNTDIEPAVEHNDAHAAEAAPQGRPQPKEILATYEPTSDMIQAMELRRANIGDGEYTMGETVSTGAMTASSKQQGFRLDSIFDVAAGDSELFGLTQSIDDEEESSEDETGPDVEQAAETEQQSQREDGGVDELVDDLDVLLGTSKLSEVRSRRSRTSAAPREWAEEDDTDVSSFKYLLPDPVIEYPFDLDVFQKRAVLRLEKGESVFVAAHTSAGKTVVAEYAIALSLSHHTKAVYTSPIKTLSNQKFRDFSSKFPSVGIVTGDVSINPEASCLVMTTEILRSMLYKGADIIRDIEWVIFDEVHYVSDEERGVVWEEVIIMLPEHVGMIMLSATVPNAVEFASWVGQTKKRKMHVISTYTRPVPLEHSILIKKELFTLVDTKRQFLRLNYKNAFDREQEQMKKSGRALGGGGRKHAWPPLANFVKDNSLTPTVVFCFSKRLCEEAVESLRSLDLSAGAVERAQVHIFFDNAIKRLSPGDRSLPQIGKVRSTLRRGIGMHHAGLLPIVKEITEILFQRGLVKILFATETFAMGVNMPARSVVFSSLRKHDGRSFRFLEPGEYTQMAGRAGRRGLDTVGTVLLYFPTGSIPADTDLRSIMVGIPHRLRSQFRLTYNMILNLLRVEDIKVEDIIRRSFSESLTERDGKKIRKLLSAGRKRLRILSDQRESLTEFVGYFETYEKVVRLSQEINTYLFSTSPSAFADGRIVVLSRSDRGLNVGMVLRKPRPTGGATRRVGSSSDLKATVLCIRGGPVVKESPFYDLHEVLPDSKQIGGIVYEVRDVDEKEIMSVFKKRIKVDVGSILPLRGAPVVEEMARVIEEIRKFADSSTTMPFAHPQKDLGIGALEVCERWTTRDQYLAALWLDPCHSSRRFQEAAVTLESYSKLLRKVQALEWAASDESLQLLPDYAQRIDVLQRLQYISEDNSVQLKGRAACEVNSCDSLILTELVFENVLSELSAAQCAALLSTLVFQEKTDVEFELPEEMLHAKSELSRILLALGTVQADCGLPVSALEYERESARFGLLVPVLEWAKGAPFADICGQTDVQEGTIVRCIVRLSDLIRETRNVARAIGNIEMMTKMATAMELIRRDIIFAASLYLS